MLLHIDLYYGTLQICKAEVDGRKKGALCARIRVERTERECQDVEAADAGGDGGRP